MTEQSMLNLVPFAGARRIVTHFNRQSCFVGQMLKFVFPKLIAMAVACTAVRRDQKTLWFRVPLLTKLSPPAANRFDRKFTCIATDANRNPGLVGINIVDAVGNRLAELLVRKIVCVDLKRLSFRAILLSNVRFFSSISFFFVSTDTAGRFPRWQARTRRARCSNWALRSGWSVPSRVLQLPCKEYPSERKTWETFIRPTAKP